MSPVESAGVKNTGTSRSMSSDGGRLHHPDIYSSKMYVCISSHDSSDNREDLAYQVHIRICFQ